MSELLRAWLVLLVASLATTSAALLRLDGLWVVAGLLGLALVKSRVIFSQYLRLNQVPPVRRGFMAVYIVWAGVALGLVFAAQS